MNRQAFLLGLFATGGQILLLRELVASLGGTELFIGTALFGWLLAVAIGAWAGGKWSRVTEPAILLVIGAVLLPLTIIAARLAPLGFGATVGESVPLLTSFAISILVMTPIGIIAGWLFPAIARHRQVASDAIVQVYLFEGLGAFAAGLAVVLAVGSFLSTLAASLALMVIILIALIILPQRRLAMVGGLAGILALALLVAVGFISRPLDRTLDSYKYDAFNVIASFDTPYSHQTILARDSTYILLTDNAVEAVYPDLAAAENRLLPALAYRPHAQSALYIGRAEFGIGEIAARFPDLSLTAIDPRNQLTAILDTLPLNDLQPIHQLPHRFITEAASNPPFDIIILDPGNLATYRTASTLTPAFLADLKFILNDSGLILLPTNYDTERYVGTHETEILADIRTTLAQHFTHVTLWPGEQTLILAADAPLFVPVDSVLARLNRLPYEPSWVAESYLFDRLNPFRTSRLNEALADRGNLNTIDQPILSYAHLALSVERHPADAALVRLSRRDALWRYGLPFFLLLLFAYCLTGRGRHRRFGLFLYFVAGIVSLSAELLAFYVYQARVGSLYSEIALLIGTFMLGLAVGAWYSGRQPSQRGLAWPALSTLIMALLIYLFLTDYVAPAAFLLYHTLFLFVTAAATGSLFVAATRRYYPLLNNTNRGLGYAGELLGSSLGALLVPAVLLPLFGVELILIGLALLVVLAGLGAGLTDRPA